MPKQALSGSSESMLTAGPAIAIFFALTGTLMATSVFNVGNSGIAFFYLVFLLPLIRLVFPGRSAIRNKPDPRSRAMTIVIGITITALLATTVLQMMILTLRDSGSEVIHLASRLSFLLYFLIAQRYLQAEMLTETFLWLRRFLIAVCAYGVYQLPAKLLGLPLFLDWLRNNRSFDTYSYDTAGWIGLVRATSIYAEPSQATIPILVLFILNLQIKSSTFSKVIGWVALTLFTIMTFSRTAWLAVVVETLSWLLFRSQKFSRIVLIRRATVLTATLLLFLISPIWGFIEAGDNVDLSAQERSGGIVLGIQMIKDAPLLGLGWNSFSDAAVRYSTVGPSVSSSVDFGFIHNMLVSYVQQAGLSGLFLAALPFILLVCWSTAPSWITYATVGSFLVTAELGDIGYSSLTWLWLALLINSGFVEQHAQPNWGEVISWRPAYKGRMSESPHSAS
jgi:O-antigen ligase/polysaccharide polymerase Wzy-like membrane protein